MLCERTFQVSRPFAKVFKYYCAWAVPGAGHPPAGLISVPGRPPVNCVPAASAVAARQRLEIAAASSPVPQRERERREGEKGEPGWLDADCDATRGNSDRNADSGGNAVMGFGEKVEGKALF